MRLPMSLLAAFAAMLGKQWLNRYLRHTGRSMVDRCGDHQRKYGGLEKWPFHLFIESLPTILQVAFLLICGLSRNTSAVRVVISFVILGTLFYIGIVVVGTSSYERPFQTPASIALRAPTQQKTLEVVGNFVPARGRRVSPYRFDGHSKVFFLGISP